MEFLGINYLKLLPGEEKWGRGWRWRGRGIEEGTVRPPPKLGIKSGQKQGPSKIH
jgi:hypothetical protein